MMIDPPYVFDDEYLDCVNDLLCHPLVTSMKNFMQHGDTNCFKHSIHVSYGSYLICKRFGLDYSSAARGGLLHDFFLYDWHDLKTHKRGHGLRHPKIALSNASTHFKLNKRERDIIRKHMWPLTLRLPRYLETYVVMAVDKYCALRELIVGAQSVRA